MDLKKLFLFILIPLLNGCMDEDYTPYSYSNESTIYSQDDRVILRELLLVLKPHLEGKKYIVTDSVFDIVIKLNNKDWGKFSSMAVDTSLFKYTVSSGRLVSDVPVEYPVIATFQPSADTLSTAGEYSDLLGDHFTLEPGFYICEIKSISLKDQAGNIKTVKTGIRKVVEVKENSRSAFVGEFEVLVN